MEKITKLATIVAKAARMEKKAEYYDAIATFINPDGNYFEKRKFMGEYTEDEIIKEVIREFPKVKKEDIDIEFGVQSSQKIKMHKKAEWSEDNFQGLWDMSFANRIVFKSILKNMSLEQQSNFSKWMQANKTEDEIRAFNEKYTLDELLSSKRIKLTKKASNYKGKVAEMLNDINDPNPLIDYISESDAKKICEELDIPHEASWYKGDLRGYVEEMPYGMVDVLIEYISESDARGLWRNIKSSKKSNLTKKAIKLNPVYFESNGNSKIQDELKKIDDLRKQIVEESNIREIKNLAQAIVTTVDEYKRLLAEKNDKK